MQIRKVQFRKGKPVPQGHTTYKWDCWGSNWSLPLPSHPLLAKGTFHAKMGSINDRNGRALTEAEDIKKRWQEYTEELYKKDLHNPDNHDGIITHLEPEIWNVKSSGP